MNIKFRAWDKENKNMVEVEFLGEKTIKPVSYEWENMDDFIIMQYTGKKDENGKEIYKGDIVKVEDYLAVIEWDAETCRFVINIHAEHLIYDFDNVYSKELEVIGNIYDNSELLKD